MTEWIEIISFKVHFSLSGYVKKPNYDQKNWDNNQKCSKQCEPETFTDLKIPFFQRNAHRVKLVSYNINVSSLSLLFNQLSFLGVPEFLPIRVLLYSRQKCCPVTSFWQFSKHWITWKNRFSSFIIFLLALTTLTRKLISRTVCTLHLVSVVGKTEGSISSNFNNRSHEEFEPRNEKTVNYDVEGFAEKFFQIYINEILIWFENLIYVENSDTSERKLNFFK